MQFKFTDEQRMIREAVGTACRDHSDMNKLLQTIEKQNGFDCEAWTTLTQTLGVGGTAIGQADGGAGLGYTELASIFEKMGRVLLPTPFLTSIGLCATILSRSQNTALKSQILPELISGEKIASFVYLASTGKSSAASGNLKFDSTEALSGNAAFVQYGDVADYFFVLCEGADGVPTVYALDAKAGGITVKRKTSMDLTRPMSDISFERAEVIGELLSEEKDIDFALNIGRVCLASEQLGAAEAVLEQTRDYALERKQFGRKIGSFQAVKHRLADMMVLVEAAKSTAWYAACAADENPEELAMAAATAMVVTTRALSRNASHMIQLHGGMGFTWECPAHLYFKRAAVSAKLLGSPEDHRESLAKFALGESA